MGNRTKRIFISDIHMGDARSMNDPNHYGWFKKNIPLLGKFLDDQIKASDVKEVVILGDLFDESVMPVNYDPLTSLEDICSNRANKPIIDKFKALAAAPDIKFAYVPGNHDMGMDVAGISATKRFMEANFPGIRFFCNNTVPWGIYNVGTLAAEHGNHYCLFNAPDLWTANDTFLPLGYFISRIIAYKVLMTGHAGDPRDIFFNFLKDFMKHPDFIEDMFNAIADDAGLRPGDIIRLNGIPGYPAEVTVGDIGSRFSHLIQNWKNTPGNINVPAAIISDLENLSFAASLVYFEHFGSNTNIVIFGHTHIPTMDKQYDLNPLSDNTGHTSDDPCIYIYANSGTWVDQGKKGCTYVETEEVQSTKRHYVRVKKYPSGDSIYEAFVGM
jgi:UDP-2,3-diacylglucosamine pyrophosphatase LpxH